MTRVTDRKLIVGNWKMNLTIHEASLYVHKLDKDLAAHRTVETVLAPSLLALQTLSTQIDHKKFKLAAQNFYWRDEGAFTGEISAQQLHGLVSYAIVGHSERRHVFHEGDKEIRAKMQAAVRNNITPILCVGETAHERSEKETDAVLHDQLIGGLANLTAEEVETIVIAYEPVWAIGTGNNAAPHDVEAAIASIRRQIEHLYGKKASKLRVIYGGSVSGASAASYLRTPGVDGLLPGGASLKLDEFKTIIDEARKVARGGK